jgi:hypothetical protein
MSFDNFFNNTKHRSPVFTEKQSRLKPDESDQATVNSTVLLFLKLL